VRATHSSAGRQHVYPTHWLIGLGIFAALGAFIVFAFRQGSAVKPSGVDHNNDASNGSADAFPPSHGDHFI
jgi:hypothetical protein